MRKFPSYKGKLKLNLGCGAMWVDEYIGIDIRDCGQKMVWDVTQGLPFPDGSVDEVYSCHFLEHLTDDESVELFQEIYRVLKVGGETRHRLPCQTHPTAYYWGHKTFWNKEKIAVIIRVPGLEKFNVVENEEQNGELLFALKKIG